MRQSGEFGEVGQPELKYRALENPHEYADTRKLHTREEQDAAQGKGAHSRVCWRRPSCLQLSTDPHIQVEKLPKARERTTGKEQVEKLPEYSYRAHNSLSTDKPEWKNLKMHKQWVKCSDGSCLSGVEKHPCRHRGASLCS